MLLDTFLPRYDVRDVHAVVARATPERTFRALRELTPAEIPLVRLLFWARALPARLLGLRAFFAAAQRPLLEQVLEGSFVLLGEIPDRELVLGTIGQFWKAAGGAPPQIADAQAFLRFDQPGYAKAAITFVLEGIPDGTRLTTETRIVPLDLASRRAFGRYWRVIQLGSALIRVLWLRAIKRRAESTPAGVTGSQRTVGRGNQ